MTFSVYDMTLTAGWTGLSCSGGGDTSVIELCLLLTAQSKLFASYYGPVDDLYSISLACNLMQLFVKF